MEKSNNKENSIKKIYGQEDLKEILSNLLEKVFIEKIENTEKLKR